MQSFFFLVYLFCFASSTPLFLLPVRSFVFSNASASLAACGWVERNRHCYITAGLPFYTLHRIYSMLYSHSTFNFKARLQFFMLATLWSRKCDFFSTHLLQARTMSHREVKWWVKSSHPSPPAHAASLSWVKISEHTSSPGANTRQVTPVWLLTPLCGQRAAGKWICSEEACVCIHMFYLLCRSNPVDQPVFIMTSCHQH